MNASRVYNVHHHSACDHKGCLGARTASKLFALRKRATRTAGDLVGGIAGPLIAYIFENSA